MKDTDTAIGEETEAGAESTLRSPKERKERQDRIERDFVNVVVSDVEQKVNSVLTSLQKLEQDRMYYGKDTKDMGLVGKTYSTIAYKYLGRTPERLMQKEKKLLDSIGTIFEDSMKTIEDRLFDQGDGLFQKYFTVWEKRDAAVEFIGLVEEEMGIVEQEKTDLVGRYRGTLREKGTAIPSAWKQETFKEIGQKRQYLMDLKKKRNKADIALRQYDAEVPARENEIKLYEGALAEIQDKWTDLQERLVGYTASYDISNVMTRVAGAMGRVQAPLDRYQKLQKFINEGTVRVTDILASDFSGMRSKDARVGSPTYEMERSLERMANRDEERKLGTEDIMKKVREAEMYV
ncbi:hypothetical protein JXB02_02275 [Candidatus Woesearchaeota archaeon]|nr:hypothetical protein [Candidatus Woesearchaeota archaeon]